MGTEKSGARDRGCRITGQRPVSGAVWFTASGAIYTDVIDDNAGAVDEAAKINADWSVMVVGDLRWIT